MKWEMKSGNLKEFGMGTAIEIGLIRRWKNDTELQKSESVFGCIPVIQRPVCFLHG